MEDFSVPVDGFFNPFRPGPNSNSNPPPTDETSPTPVPPKNQRSLLDETMRDLKRQLSDMDHDIGWTARHFGVPRITSRSPYYLCPSLESMKGLQGTESKPGPALVPKYRMNIPLGINIRPEDIKVSLRGNLMTIDVRKEERTADGNGRVYQEYVRQFTLPERLDMKQVKSTLSPEGHLSIEVPSTQATLPEKTGDDWDHVTKSKGIPIDMSSDENPGGCIIS